MYVPSYVYSRLPSSMNLVRPRLCLFAPLIRQQQRFSHHLIRPITSTSITTRHNIHNRLITPVITTRKMSTSEPADQTASQTPKTDGEVTEKLPPLSDHEFRQYNRMAERMDAFHNYFRQSWNLLWTACTQNHRPKNMTIRQFIGEGLSFAEHLTLHHSIEERYIFPMLGQRMPEFRGDLPAQHREIHAGLVGFEEYLKGCLAKKHEFELSALKAKMETWGDVLWAHLDDEVRTLGAENMRKYWSIEEMKNMRM